MTTHHKKMSAAEKLARDTIERTGGHEAALRELRAMHSNPPPGMSARMVSRAIRYLWEVPELRALATNKGDK